MLASARGQGGPLAGGACSHAPGMDAVGGGRSEECSIIQYVLCYCCVVSQRNAAGVGAGREVGAGGRRHSCAPHGRRLYMWMAATDAIDAVDAIECRRGGETRAPEGLAAGGPFGRNSLPAVGAVGVVGSTLGAGRGPGAGKLDGSVQACSVLACDSRAASWIAPSQVLLLLLLLLLLLRAACCLLLSLRRPVARPCRPSVQPPRLLVQRRGHAAVLPSFPPPPSSHPPAATACVCACVSLSLP